MFWIPSIWFKHLKYALNKKKSRITRGSKKKKDHAPEKDEAALSHSQKLASAELLPPEEASHGISQRPHINYHHQAAPPAAPAAAAQHMGVSKNSGFSPQIIHFNRIFHYKPSILGYPYFWKHPYVPPPPFLAEVSGLQRIHAAFSHAALRMPKRRNARKIGGDAVLGSTAWFF